MPRHQPMKATPEDRPLQGNHLYQINVTRDCNLRCSHCYIHSEVKAASQKMEADNLLTIGHQIVEHMEHIGYERAEIHIIGGEPTMLGVDFFEEVIPKFKAIVNASRFDAEVSIVTNLLTPDALRIANLFDRVTTSYEPETRFPKAKIEQKWRDNVKLLQDDNIEIGVTTAMTRQTIDYGANRLMDQLMGQDIKKIHLGFFIPEGDGLVNLDSVFPPFHETTRFLQETLDWYLPYRDDPDLFLNPFESLITAIHTGDSVDDIVCPIIPGSIDINWDGNAVSCIEAGGSIDQKFDGNVLLTSIKDVTETRSFKKEVRNARRPKEPCFSCEEFDVCRSGCGVLFKHWSPEEDEECPGFKGFIKYVRQLHEQGIRPKYVVDGQTDLVL